MDCARNGRGVLWNHQDLPEDVVEYSPVISGFTPINLPSAQATQTLTDGANPRNGSKKRNVGQLATTPTAVKRVRKSFEMQQTPLLQLPTATERRNSIPLTEREAAIHENPGPEQLPVNQLPVANTGVKISANTMRKLSSWMYNPRCETEISRGSSTLQTVDQCEAVPDSEPSQRHFVSGETYDELNVREDSFVGPSDVKVRDANSRAELDGNDVHARFGNDFNNQHDVDMDSSLTESNLEQVLVYYGLSPISSMEFEENADMLVDEEEVAHLTPEPYAQESMFPPSSLQCPFDESSETHEVYDAGLQHSSPSPVGRASSSEVERMLGRVDTCTTMDNFRKGLSGSSPGIQHVSASRTLNGLEEVEEDLFGDVSDHDMLDFAEGVREPENSKPTSAVPSSLARPIGLFFKPPTFYKPGQSSMMTQASLMAPGPSQHREMTNAESSSPSSYKSKFSSPIRARGHTTSSKTFPSSASSITAEMPPPNVPETAKHLVAFDSNGNALPFTRPPFPDKVQDRSPIPGLSNASLLRVCFRIGEALNAAALAERTNIDLLFELYARVTYSHREGVEQHFQFADLFHSDKPPYLNGTYIGWKGCPLGELDTGAFLTGPARKIARCVGKIKRNGPATKWKIIILSIWHADWEDIGYVKGIVCA